MPKVERIRETVTGPLGFDYVKQRTDAGWHLVAVEWEREVEEAAPERTRPGEPVPYGSQVARDCTRLEESSSEMNALSLILELIVQDRSLSNMAETLNQHGFRTREGTKWTAVSVYNLLPRLIEVSPRILSTEAWQERRKQMAENRE